MKKWCVEIKESVRVSSDKVDGWEERAGRTGRKGCTEAASLG